MRFSIRLPTDRVDRGSEFGTGPAVAEMARAAEAAGFDACFVTDHPFPTEKWLRGGGHHALDPFVALSFAAAATTRLRVQTHILVLGYRNPFLVAKAAASLDVLSEGRLILGVAAGYLRGEFAALGGDFDARNEVADEAIVAIRRAWTEDGVEMEGRHFRAVGNTMLPRPVQEPHPPLWIGGNSRRAIRRAVELGDGWLPFPNPPAHAAGSRTPSLESTDDLRGRLAWARRYAREIGRTAPLDVAFAPPDGSLSGPDADPGRAAESVAELHELGVTWIHVAFAATSRGAFCGDLDRFGATVLARLR